MSVSEILAVRNKDGRVIGQIAHGIFTKTISEKHLLRKPPAICIDKEPYEDLIRPSCNTIRVIVRDGPNHGEYTTPMAIFDALKGKINRHFGDQYFMILERWQKK